MTGSGSKGRASALELARAAYEAAPVGLVVYAEEGPCVLANPAAAAFIGATVEEMLQQSFREVESWQRSGLLTAAEEALGGTECVDFELRTVSSFGKEVWTDCLLSCLQFDGGKYLQIALQDASERMAESAASESRYHDLINALESGLVIHAPDTSILFANPAAVRILGLSEARIQGVTAMDPAWHFVREDGSRMPLAEYPVNRVIASGEPLAGYVVGADRSDRDAPRWFLCSAFPARGPSGDLESVVVSFIDFTDRLEAEAALRQQRREWEATFAAITDWVMIVDPRRHVILASNPASVDFVDLAPEEIVGRRCCELVHGTSTPVEGCPCVGVCRSAVRETMEVAIGDGSRWVEVTVDPILDEHGELRTAVHIARDITERKRVDQERARVDKLESLGILAGGVAHDFNNILTAVIANLSLGVEEARAGEDITPSVSRSLTAARRAAGLTQQLLTFSKGGAPVTEPGSVGDLVEETVGFALSGSGSRADVHLAGDLWSADVDRGQISQVIENLVINADQAMPDGGVVRVEASNLDQGGDETPPIPGMEPGRYVRITVADDGVGIAPKHLDKVFDPFFTTKQMGSGLGLATSHSIARRHGGHLSVCSELGQGTTFTLHLPACAAEVEPVGLDAESPPPGSGRILLMDDEEMVLDTAARLLERLGYEVVTTADGEECLAAFTRGRESGEPFDLVILDLTVPGGMGGTEAIRRLLELDPAVRALVSSGYSNDPAMSDAAAHGFAGVVAKPYTMDTLGEAVAKALLPRG